MQQNSSKTAASAPALKNQKPISGLEHLNHLGEQSYVAEVKLSATAKGANCSFWVGIYGSGNATPADISAETTPDLILAKAAKEGLNASEAILLSDCESGETSYTLLIPKAMQDVNQWIDSLLFSVESIKPSVIGLYLPKELMDKKTLEAALTTLFEKSLSKGNLLFSKFYIITPGYAYNETLNLIFDIKRKMNSDKQLDIKLLH